MKYRVERSRLDHGYGLTWVVLDPNGEYVLEAHKWSDALRLALVCYGHAHDC